MLHKCLSIGLWCAGVLGAVATSARAEPAQPTEDAGPRRALAGHVFFPSLVVNDPFVSTYFSLSTALGYEWIDGPDFDLRGNLVGTTRSYSAEAMTLAGAFQASLTGCLAIRAAAGGGLDGGADARSAVVVGMVQPISAGGGATLSGRFGDHARLGATFDFVYSHTRLIQPLVAIRDSLATAQVQAGSATEKLDSWTLLPGVALALAPFRSVGILASAQFSWTTQTDGDTRHFRYVALGASTQVDLRPGHGMPLGLLVSYRGTIPFESDMRLTSTVEGGLFYTGRRELDLGIDAQVKWFDLRPDHLFRLDTTELIATAVVRYHWN